MYNHEPENYDCPFCRVVQQAKQQGVHSSDIIHHSDSVTAFLALGRWEYNPVDILIVPNAHIENIYDLPLDYSPLIHQLARAIALAMKTIYHSDGVSTRQNNEPAGNQDVWHYHVHVTPRYAQDNFYCSRSIAFPEQERFEHARNLRDFMREHAQELF